MGGRGTFAIGNNVAFRYETVGKVDGIKVLEKINKSDSRNLPEESHSSNAYLQLNSDGTFSKYREYDTNHNPVLDIEYGTHRGKKFLHIHEYIDGKRQEAVDINKRPEYLKKYSKFFRGIRND
jgi:hypothetical protein